MKGYAICHVAVAAMRKEGSEQSEMVNQMLFGEVGQILEMRGSWYYITLLSDHYHGWVNGVSIAVVEKDKVALNQSCIVKSNMLLCMETDNNQRFLIPSGSLLHNYNPDNKCFGFDGRTWVVKDGETCSFTNSLTPEQACKYAEKFINAPYLWGGRTFFGIDCSGITQLVYRIAGIQLPRDASQQVMLGEEVSFLQQSKPGDLAFFENDNGNIVHVGIIINEHQIIHASGAIRIDKIDQQGIFNIAQNRYTHKLRVIKRLFGNDNLSESLSSGFAKSSTLN